MLANNSQQTNRFNNGIDLICCLCFLWFSAVILGSAFHTPIDFDTGIHALIAKSLAMGEGWRTSYSFYADNTSGPVIIIPAAFFTWLLGAKLWVPAFSAAVTNLSIFAFLLFMARTVLPRITWAAFSTGLLFFFSFFEPTWWCVLTGDLSSYFFLLIACLIVAQKNSTNNKRDFFLLGMMFGLSCFSKMVAMAGFFGVFLFIFYTEVLANKKNSRVDNLIHLIKNSLYFILGAAAIFFLFNLFEMYTYPSQNIHHSNLDFERYSYPSQGIQYGYFDFIQKRMQGWAVIFKNQSVSLSSLFDIKNALFNQSYIPRKVYSQMLSRYGFGPSISYIMLFLPVLIVLVINILNIKKTLSAIDKIITLLTLCLVAYIVQFFIIYKVPFEHHALQMMYTLFILIFLIGVRFFRFYSTIVFILFFVGLSSHDNFIEFKARSILTYEETGEQKNRIEYIKASLDVSNFISQGNFQFPLANCGWANATREIDYILPGYKNFINCFDLLAENYVLDVNSKEYYWNKPVSFTLVINNYYWRVSKQHKPTRLRQNALIAACHDQLLYESKYYRIMECPYAQLNKVLPKDPTNPFAPRPPEWNDFE